MSELIAEATRRSQVVWVGTRDCQPRAVWHVWHAGAAYVLSGPGEQRVPPLEDGGTAHVVVRSKDRQGDRIADWEATVTRLAPGTAEWDEVVPLLHVRRLNAPDGEDQPARWARECQVWQLRPTGELR